MMINISFIKPISVDFLLIFIQLSLRLVDFLSFNPVKASVNRSSGSVLVERNMQNETVASLEARSTERDSVWMER